MLTEKGAEALQRAHEELDNATMEIRKDDELINQLDAMMKQIRLILRKERPSRSVEVL